MKFKNITKIFVATFCVCCMAQPALAETTTTIVAKPVAKLIKVKTAWVVGQEAFAIWYAKKQGWDNEVGLDINMQIYQAGKDALIDFNVNSWFIGGLGALPTIMGAAEGNMSVIAIAGNEAKANAIMVRADSPMLTAKGINNDYPMIYGSPATVKGKTILVSKATSAHYVLHMWLKALALTENDVKLQNLTQEFALLSFDHGKGDAVALWAPYTFVGAENSWKTVATAKDINAELPIFLVANTAFTEQYPEVTKNFLGIYMRAVQWILDTPRQEVIAEIRAYYKDVFNQDYSDTMVNLQFDIFEVFGLETQKKLFAITDKTSKARAWQNEISSFFTTQGILSTVDAEKISGSSYITSKFIDMITPAEVEIPTEAKAETK